MIRRTISLGLATAVTLAATGSALALTGKEFLAKYNKDKDSTVEIVEAIDLGTKTFKLINPDKDKTLEPNETKGRLTDADWAAVNKDGDQTLELDEWLIIVRKRFNDADADKDGKVSEAELDSPTGQQLILLIAK